MLVAHSLLGHSTIDPHGLGVGVVAAAELAGGLGFAKLAHLFLRVL